MLDYEYKANATVIDCAANFCTSNQMAAYDFKQVQLRAENLVQQAVRERLPRFDPKKKMCICGLGYNYCNKWKWR